MGSAAAMGDRVIQMESMDGAARCLEALRLQHKICNCRPLEFNTRLLEVASSVGAKVRIDLVYDKVLIDYFMTVIGPIDSYAVVSDLRSPGR